MRIYVISKGRLGCVKRLLLSLDVGRVENQVTQWEAIVIFDDDRCDRLATELEQWSRRLSNVHVSGLRMMECAELIAAEKSRWPRGYEKMIPRLLRTPRTGTWEPGGVRNLTVAHARQHSPDVCFWIDDDIVFGIHEENGLIVMGDGAVVLDAMMAELEGCAIAAGCGYVGTDDLSQADHAKQLLLGAGGMARSHGQSQADCLGVLEGVPDSLPIRVTMLEAEHADAYRGPAGVSSGCLALNWRTRDFPPVPYWYNEDWIWLCLVVDGVQSTRRVKGKVVHAPPPESGLNTADVVRQQVGEAVYEIVVEQVAGTTGHEERARAVAESPDYLFAERLQVETDALLEIARSASRIGKGLDKLPKAQTGARRMSDVFSLAARELQKCDASRIGSEVRDYAQFLLAWDGAAKQ